MEGWRVSSSTDRKTGGLVSFFHASLRLFGHAAILPQFSAIIAGGLFITSFSLYLNTLAPSVATLFDDSLEFQLVTYQLGIAHPTGYPLYTLLGKLFTLLPVGNVAYRVNLMSAIFGAATVALLYLLILQLATPKDRKIAEREQASIENINHPPTLPRHLGAILGALLLAVSRVFWQQATIAEVYTLNAFFVASLLWLVIVLSPPHQPGSAGIFGLAFLAGLSLTHHRTMLLLLPALALYLYLTHKPISWVRPGGYKKLLLTVLVGLAPLLLYLYLPWRGHVGSLDGTYQNTWAGFWQQISASGYTLFIFDNPFGQERHFAGAWQLLQGQFYTVGPGLIGLFYLLWAGQSKRLALTGLAFLSYTTFNLFYQVADIEVFFIPVFVIWAAWSGAGLAFLFQLVLSLKSKRWQPILGALLGVVFMFILIQLIQVNYPVVTQDYTWQVHDYGLDMLQQPLPSTGQTAIIGILGEMTLLRYFQQTEQRRPDIQTVAADQEGTRLAAVEKLLAEGKSVYLTRELPGAPERWSLSAVGPLIQVKPKPLTTPEVSFALKQAITPEIMLLGYELSRPPQTGQGPAPVRLTLFWQAVAPIGLDLKVSARLLNSAGETITAVDAVPVHFAYPTTAWRPGEIVADVYDLALPVDASPGPYTPLLIWYDPAQHAAEVGRIELEPVMIN